MGFLFLALFIIAVGLVGTNFIGKKVVAMGEKILHHIPVVRVIYTSIKKVVDTVSLTETPSFQKMVLVTYPREPLKTLGIVCCDTPEGITKGEKMLNLYQFHSKVAKHFFCSVCGIYTHHNPRANPAMTGFNVGCIDEINTFDIEEVPVNDGQNHPLDKK